LSLNQKIIRENQLDFLLNLHQKGIDIGDEQIALLRKHKLIPEAFTKEARDKIIQEAINKRALTPGPKTQQANSLVDIVEINGKPEDINVDFSIISDEELEDRRLRYGHKFIGRDGPILSYEWKPESTTEHAEDFIEWINSINRRGFRNRTGYHKFSLYCQQAYQWLSESKSYADLEDEDERMEFMLEECRRADENSLYFLNKYVYYKEGDADDDNNGRVKYIAAPAHEFLAYMNDCGYSLIFAKGRQMAATTTLMALDVHDVIFKQNHFMKFITEDKDKAIEIIEDKLKFVFANLPWWMAPDVLNDRDDVFKMGFKEEKGRKQGIGSKIQISPPKRTAVAGGAPQVVKIDEAGNIGNVGAIISNLRPTMLFFDPKTRKLRVKRRLWVWGTGGEMEKGGKAFETEMTAMMGLWDKRDFSSGIIPVFLDWTCRPGATQELYDSEKALAYAKGAGDSPDAKKHITEFHQTWPSTLADVFRTSARTLVDDEYIQAGIRRIQEAKSKFKGEYHQSGYFDPVFDYNEKMPEGSDVDYKIIGANFVPTRDTDARATVTLFMHPDYGWENRYWQGTDPIDTDTGLSNMASTVWDKEWKCPVAILNWRTRDYRQVFMQTLLLGLYYDTSPTRKGIKELLEANRGTSYTEYKRNKGFGDNMVLNFQLPFRYQNRSTINESVGIDNKQLRNTMIINDMHDMLELYGDRINHEVIFHQLQTFTCMVSDKGKEVWGVVNKKHFKDDVLFSTTFAYICSELCFPELKPKNTVSGKTTWKIVYKLVRDQNLKLNRVAVRVAA
jgi:hypothetical protein